MLKNNISKFGYRTTCIYITLNFINIKYCFIIRRANDMFFKISLFLLTQQFTNINCELIQDPSLKPAEHFVKSNDAEFLLNEMHSDVINRDEIAKLMFHRSLEQRIQISDIYNENYAYINKFGQTCYRTTLDYDLFSISLDNLSKLYALIFDTFDAQLANTLHKAISNDSNEENVVEEIVCANDEFMKDQIENFYEKGMTLDTNEKSNIRSQNIKARQSFTLGYIANSKAYQCKVEEHLALFHNKDDAYQEAIHKYCWQSRCQEKKLTPEEVDKEVKSLQDIDPKKDREGFKKKLKELLDKYCEPDLKEIFNKYKKDDHRISDGVDEAFDGNEKIAFNAVVRYIENTCMFYADELYHAVHGLGTDINKINRIVLTRSERDLACVLREFENKRHETFTERLKSDTLSEPRYLECIRYLCGKP